MNKTHATNWKNKKKTDLYKPIHIELSSFLFHLPRIIHFRNGWIKNRYIPLIPPSILYFSSTKGFLSTISISGFLQTKRYKNSAQYSPRNISLLKCRATETASRKKALTRSGKDFSSYQTQQSTIFGYLIDREAWNVQSHPPRFSISALTHIYASHIMFIRVV